LRSSHYSSIRGFIQALTSIFDRTFVQLFAVGLAGSIGFGFVSVGVIIVAGNTIYSAMAIAGTAGVGLGAWVKLEKPAKQRILNKIFSILAFPWFCWFPISLIFGTIALYQLFNQAGLYLLPIWQQIAAVEAALLGICVCLWQRGQQLEAIHRNPFKGGLLEVALKKGYGEY
jgi:hypothetical protein